MTNAHDKDLELWNKWKANKSPRNLSALTKQLKPIIYRATMINMGSLSPSVIEAEAKIQAKKAFDTFNPSRGVKLSTHVTNYMKKVSRLNYKHQEIFSVPEDRRIKFKSFAMAKDDLVDSLGRDPNVNELSDHLSWSKSEVKRFNKEDVSEFSDSQPYSSDLGMYDTKRETLTSYVYNNLNPKHQSVMEYTMGYNGVKTKSNSAIMSKLKITQGQLSYAKSQITKELKTAFGGE